MPAPRVDFCVGLHVGGKVATIIPPDEFLALLTAALDRQGAGDTGRVLEAMRAALADVEAEARRQFRAS